MTVKLVNDKGALAAMSVFEPILIQHIKDEQFTDPKLARIQDHIADRPDFHLVDGVLYFKDKLCVPAIKNLMVAITIDAHLQDTQCTPRVTTWTRISKACFAGITTKDKLQNLYLIAIPASM